MNLLLLLDMVAAGRGDEVAVQAGDDRLTAGELLAGAWTGAAVAAGASALAYVGTNGLAFPIGLFAAAAAGVPFVPLSYRLSDDQLHDLLAPLGDVDLTNAYGLTETSSTIAVLGPDDHRAARAGDPMATARLSSAGRVLPTVEVEVRGPLGEPLSAGEPGVTFAETLPFTETGKLLRRVVRADLLATG